MAIIKTDIIPNITAYADAVKAGFTGSYEAWCSVLGSISGDQEAVSINKIHYTLLARGWSNNVYDLEYVYPSSDYLFLFIDKDGDNITEEQLSWWYAADMSGSTDNKIIANDETPEVDIPIIITMIEKTTIGGGGDGNYQEKTVNPQEQTQQVTADSGYDALSKVVVNGARLQEKTVTLGSAQQVTPDSGYYGLKKVNVPAAPTPSLGTKSISVNGTYNASADNLDGFSSVEVNVSGGGGGTYQQKTVHPSTSQQSVQPDQGYDALSAVVVEAMDLESKTAQVSQTSQTITPSSGKDGLSRVEIPAALLQTKNVTLGSSAQQITADSGFYGLEQVNVPAASTPDLQSKTVHPSTEQQTVLPDTGKDGLSSVVVEAMNLQSKTATASTTAITVTPDANADGLSQVTVNALNLQSKQVTPSGSAQIVTADQNYDGLAQVEVAAASIPTLVAKNIIENGTYNPASDNADGYSTVTVAVPVYGGNRYDLLWENPSPNALFGTQTISISTEEQYDAILVEANAYKDTVLPDEWHGSSRADISQSVTPLISRSMAMCDPSYEAGYLGCTFWVSSSSKQYYMRQFSLYMTNGIVTGVGFNSAMYNNGSNYNNNALIPTRIYGVKGAGQTSLKPKSVTANGTYAASSDNCDGFSSVTVNVSGGGGGTGFDLLWTNPNPTADFASQTLTLDISKVYDAVLVEANMNKEAVPDEWHGSNSHITAQSTLPKITRAIAKIDSSGYNVGFLGGAYWSTSSSKYIYGRQFTVAINTANELTVSFTAAFYNNAGTNYNFTVIPTRIYGFTLPSS